MIRLSWAGVELDGGWAQMDMYDDPRGDSRKAMATLIRGLEAIGVAYDVTIDERRVIGLEELT